jgi:hypothetical protein
MCGRVVGVSINDPKVKLNVQGTPATQNVDCVGMKLGMLGHAHGNGLLVPALFVTAPQSQPLKSTPAGVSEDDDFEVKADFPMVAMLLESFTVASFELVFVLE